MSIWYRNINPGGFMSKEEPQKLNMNNFPPGHPVKLRDESLKGYCVTIVPTMSAKQVKSYTHSLSSELMHG